MKKPSEDGGDGGGPSSPSLSSTTNTATTITIRKNKGGTTTGKNGTETGPPQVRRIGGAHGHKKDDLRRVTRSRVRQAQGSNDADDRSGDQPSRKRRNRGGSQVATNSALSYEEEEMGQRSGETAQADSALALGELAMMDTGEEEQQKNSEDSQQSGTLMGSAAPTGGNQTDKEKVPVAAAKPSAAALLLAKNSLEQSVGFEAMMRSKWGQQYKAHLAYVMDRFENGNFTSLESQEPISSQEVKLTEASKAWPESLKKLYLEQERRRQELAEEHKMEWDRLRTMAKREMTRMAEMNAQKAVAATTTTKTEGGEMTEDGRQQQVTQQKQTGATNESGGRLFSIVTYLRDQDCYDPTLLADSFAASSPIQPLTMRCQGQSAKQVQQRFAYVANTTKNRHKMESQSLFESQKAEWQRAARRAQREYEQQQLMMKGPIGSVGKQQQQQPSIHFPPGLWMDLAVQQIPISDVRI